MIIEKKIKKFEICYIMGGLHFCVTYTLSISAVFLYALNYYALKLTGILSFLLEKP